MASARAGDLPFALDLVGDEVAEQRPERRGERDDEGVFERLVTSMPLAISSVGTQLAKP